ncbi:MAG: lipid II:glycine glycyltransferase FemX [Aggregatilineales bacterium]
MRQYIDIKIETITDRDAWNNTLREMPYAHILQTWEWGDFKQQVTGWQPLRMAFKQNDEIVAMFSPGMKRVGIFKVMYAPKAPAMDYSNDALRESVLDYLQDYARKERLVWLKIDPDVPIATGVPGEDDDTPNDAGQHLKTSLKNRGWRYSDDQVQFRNSVVIDLTPDEDTLLMNMSQNTRRKVRTAAKKDVVIREGTPGDIPMLYDLYSVTGQRDDFLLRPYEYYETLWSTFMQAGLAQVFIAEYENIPIAHVVLFHFGKKCIYFNGASSNNERKRMPNYALQWRAIQWAKAQGYTQYDMWGAPTDFIEDDPLWGVYQFKRGFRGDVTRYVGAWDYAPNNALYWSYTQAYPRFRQLLRRLRGQ